MTIRFTGAFAAMVAAAAPSAALAVGPDYQRPPIPLSAAFHAPLPTRSPQAVALETWWQGFHDPALTRAVERALAQNLDIEQARQRVLQSRAAARGAGAALAPLVQANASAADVAESLKSPIGEIGSHLPGFTRNYDDYAVGASAAWELDLFGGLHRGREAARAQARAAERDADAVAVSVAAETADAYFLVRAFQGRLAVAREQELVQQDLIDLLTRRTAEGVSPDRELRQARASLEAVRATIPPLAAGLEAQLNRLDLLMGAQAGTYHTELAENGPLPALAAFPTLDGPADLLRRRPDILAAEERLKAANAEIGARLADYYPKVSLFTLLGFESLATGQLFTSAALAHQAGARVGWRLFDFGRVDAEVAEARGRKGEALAAWRAAVFQATAEVENAFTDLAQQQARSAALGAQIEQLKVARRQSQQAYEGGVISLVEVRDADRDILDASDELVQARAGAGRAAVAAFRALGGGWTSPRALARVHVDVQLTDFPPSGSDNWVHSSQPPHNASANAWLKAKPDRTEIADGLQ